MQFITLLCTGFTFKFPVLHTSKIEWNKQNACVDHAFACSPNSKQICLTGVSKYGPMFYGFFITVPKWSPKIFSANIVPNGLSHVNDDIK